MPDLLDCWAGVAHFAALAKQARSEHLAIPGQHPHIGKLGERRAEVIYPGRDGTGLAGGVEVAQSVPD